MKSKYWVSLSLLSVAGAFVPKAHNAFQNDVALGSFSVPNMWNAGLSFGKGTFKFYRNFDDWMKVFPDEDREAYPEVFNVPKGVYEVSLTKPLGIVFEEIEVGKGVYVQGKD